MLKPKPTAREAAAYEIGHLSPKRSDRNLWACTRCGEVLPLEPGEEDCCGAAASRI